MKTVAVKIDDSLHKQLKYHSVNTEKTIAETVAELIKRELEAIKKEQTQ